MGAREGEDTISVIDESVIDLAKEARRELGIRSPETVSMNIESTSNIRPRATAKNTTRKRSCLRTGEKEVRQG